MKKKITLLFAMALLFGGLVNAQTKSVEKTKKEFIVTTVETVGHSVYSNGHSTPSPFLNAPKNTKGVLYAQHELVSNPGAGVGGTDLSELTVDQTTWGSGCQQTATNSLADDFIVPTGETWQISGFVFYAYQSFAGTTSTIDGAYAKVFDADPSTGATPIGEYWADNIMVSTEWINAYRVSNGELTNTDRAIMSITCELPVGLEASEGTYWVEWTLTGTATSGPWVPHLQLLDGTLETGNAMQNQAGTWILTMEDPVGSAQGMPFDVLGTNTEPTAPGACTDFTVTPAALGALTYDVSWTNPSVTFEGNALTEITAVALYVDGIEVTGETWDLGIGAANSATGLGITAGNHTVSVRAINSVGNGSLVSQTMFFGEDVPAAPGNVVLAATDMDVTLTWEAPITGLNGHYFSGSNLTYSVIRQPGDVIVSTDQTDLTFSETITTAGNYYYEVTASNTIGEGGTGMSNSLLIGDFIIYEDFEGTYLPTDWSEDETGGGAWDQNEGTVHPSGFPAHSGTMLAYFNAWSTSTGGTAALITPTVDLSTMTNLVLGVWVYHDAGYATSDDNIQVKMSIDDGTTWTDIGTPISRNDGTTGWAEHTFDITESGTATTKFNFFATSAYGNDVHIDDVTLTGTSTIGIQYLTSKGISIYPNPSNGLFTVNVDNNFNLEVFDITGKVISASTISGSTTLELNNSGVYFLRFSNEKGSVTQRVIVQ